MAYWKSSFSMSTLALISLEFRCWSSPRDDFLSIFAVKELLNSRKLKRNIKIKSIFFLNFYPELDVERFNCLHWIWNCVEFKSRRKLNSSHKIGTFYGQLFWYQWFCVNWALQVTLFHMMYERDKIDIPLSMNNTISNDDKSVYVFIIILIINYRNVVSFWKVPLGVAIKGRTLHMSFINKTSKCNNRRIVRIVVRLLNGPCGFGNKNYRLIIPLAH